MVGSTRVFVSEAAFTAHAERFHPDARKGNFRRSQSASLVCSNPCAETLVCAKQKDEGYFSQKHIQFRVVCMKWGENSSVDKQTICLKSWLISEPDPVFHSGSEEGSRVQLDTNLLKAIVQIVVSGKSFFSCTSYWVPHIQAISAQLAQLRLNWHDRGLADTPAPYPTCPNCHIGDTETNCSLLHWFSEQTLVIRDTDLPVGSPYVRITRLY